MRQFAIFLIACLLLVSCASKPQKKTGSPGDLYVEGINYMKQKKYEKAIEDFSYIRENFPFDPISFVATVKLGDVYFEQKEYLLASGVYEDFFNAHPGDENIPYVLSKLVTCYDKLSLTFDRDQAYTLKALERFTYLKNRYPKSPYLKEAEKDAKKLFQKLVDREIYVGEFYYRSFQYNGCVTRLEYFLKKYGGAQGTDKALFFLSKCHMELGELTQAQRYADLLKKEYPNSIFARATIRQRKSLRLAKAEVPVTYEARKRQDIELTAQPVNIAKGEPKKKDDTMSFFEENKPIDIVSDTMEGYEKEKYVVFKGNVIAKQGDLYIFADEIQAYMNEKTNEIDKAIARGNVKIVKQERTATANMAEFLNTKGEIILKGDVTVFSGQDKLVGNLVTYYINEDKVVVEGEKNKKARVIINPR